ncbi:hypothetical protein IscW_ISCW012330 [Ixodes scapularis]|uniref:Uncharacterized protein n=1 Tax=Ixodes scapularis TaxID=6945 RepID=B7QC31_IXOSC|nr:hypothetical protein IscW_ISCW012330 [Ixodes scapularis]|eukprot:XP_002413095.1 hypothetical protein IscW_ISCW012330 [Ixodes scapularis]
MPVLGLEKLIRDLTTTTGHHHLGHHTDTINRDHWLNAGYQRSHLRCHNLYMEDHWRSHACVLSRDWQLRYSRRPCRTALETGQSDPAENGDHLSVSAMMLAVRQVELSYE